MCNSLVPRTHENFQGISVPADYLTYGVLLLCCQGIGFNWCKQPERGLLRPDRVFYLEVSPKVAAQRGDYGAERYEKKDFLATVATMFDKLKDETWLVSHCP